MYPARGAPTTEAGPRLELERRADAADMSIAAGIGVAAVEHDRRRPVETMRDANADARLTLVETCIDRQRGLAGGRGHQPRGERRSRRDAPPRLDPIGVDLALQAGGSLPGEPNEAVLGALATEPAPMATAFVAVA